MELFSGMEIPRIVRHAWGSKSVSLSLLSDIYESGTLCAALASSHSKKTKDEVMGGLNSQLSEETSELRKVTVLRLCILI